MRNTDAIGTTTVCLRAAAGHVRKVEVLVRHVALDSGFPAEAIDQISGVVAEACLNAIRHGSPMGANGQITVQ